MAILLNGTSDNVLTTSNDPFSNADMASGSIECWIRIQDTPTGNEHIVNIEGWVVLFIDSSKQLNLFSDGSGSPLATTSAISTDTWYLVEANWSATTCDIYIGGAKTTGSSPTGSPTPDSNTRKMGYGANYDASANYFDGDVGPIRVSNTRRHTSGYTAPGQGLWADDANSLLIWNTNELSGTSLADTAGNGKVGTLTGGTWFDGGFGETVGGFLFISS